VKGGGLGRLSGIAALLALVAVWWAVSAAAGTPFIPSPAEVAVRLVGLASGELWRHVAASLARVAAAVTLAFAAAAPLGIAAGRSRAVDRLVAPVTYLLAPVPKIALLPVIMLLAGLGEASKVLVVFLVLFFQALVAVRDGARAVPEAWYLSIDSLGARPRHRFAYVTWPAVLPSLFSALRVGIGTALAVLFFAETFGTRRGLGYFVVESWMRMAYTDLYAGVVAFGAVGFTLTRLADAASRRAGRWQELTSPRASSGSR
jgi:NitT/TauT family transport system permease protein